jgi:hypothetical protein
MSKQYLYGGLAIATLYQLTSNTPPTPNAAAISNPPQSQNVAQNVTQSSPPSSNSDPYAGGSDSLVARVVGAAEGTRTPEGGKTNLYVGHVDPGNGVWNRGTFSYQFGNSENLSPEEADNRQMAKIRRIHESVMNAKAVAAGIAPLSQLEELNGIDLINQAPLAVTQDGGYIERLAEAKKTKGLTGEAAILEARVWAFWDEAKGGWDAPGLRAYDDLGKEASVRHDQQRRMGMIEQALAAYKQNQKAAAGYQPVSFTAQDEKFAKWLRTASNRGQEK